MKKLASNVIPFPKPYAGKQSDKKRLANDTRNKPGASVFQIGVGLIAIEVSAGHKMLEHLVQTDTHPEIFLRGKLIWDRGFCLAVEAFKIETAGFVKIVRVSMEISKGKTQLRRELRAGRQLKIDIRGKVMACSLFDTFLLAVESVEFTEDKCHVG